MVERFSWRCMMISTLKSCLAASNISIICTDAALAIFNVRTTRLMGFKRGYRRERADTQLYKLLIRNNLRFNKFSVDRMLPNRPLGAAEAEAVSKSF